MPFFKSKLTLQHFLIQGNVLEYQINEKQKKKD